MNGSLHRPLAVGQVRQDARRGAIDKKYVSQNTYGVSYEALAVAPKPVQLPERYPPSIAFPALERYAHYPARSLLQRGAYCVRKIFACGDKPAIDEPERNE